MTPPTVLERQLPADQLPEVMPDTVAELLDRVGGPTPIEPELATSEPPAPQLVEAAQAEHSRSRRGWVGRFAPTTLALGALVAVQARLAELGWQSSGHGAEKLRLAGHAYSAGSKLLAMKGIHMPELIVHETQAMLGIHGATPQPAHGLQLAADTTSFTESESPASHAVPPSDGHDTYTVKPGDNLWNIAETKERQLGLSITADHTTRVYQQMYADNKGVIGTKPGLIHPNQIYNLDGADKLIGNLEHESGSASNTNVNTPNDVTLNNGPGDHLAPAPVEGHPLPEHINNDASTDVITHGMSIENALAHKGITDRINQIQVIQQTEHDGGFPAGTVYYEPGDPLPRLRDNAAHRLPEGLVQHLTQAYRELLDEQEDDDMPRNRGGRVPALQ